MLYHLFQQLKDYDFPGQGLMNYLSFRAMAAFVISLLIAFFMGKKMIEYLQKKQIGETIRNLGIEGQLQKKGTPTMGGIIIIVSLLASVLLICNLSNIYILLLILTTIWCGAIGFYDDYIKVFKHNKEGMKPRTKILAQVALGFAIALTVCFNSNITIRENHSESTEVVSSISAQESQTEDVIKSTKTTIPFVKSHEFDYGSLSPFNGKLGWYSKWAIYVIMIIIVITACSNGANLTDGMDGLATGSSAIVGVVIGILAYLSGNMLNSDYLNIMYIPGSGEIAIFMSAFVGSLIGFLWYNSYPAQVFMGDTGSLTIGGIIGVSAILIRKELLLPVLCGIFLVESLSVLIQKGYYKYSKKKYGEGKRVFKMAPLHHHYQKEGVPAIFDKPQNAIPEAKIVNRFWIIGLILAVSTLALLKIR